MPVFTAAVDIRVAVAATTIATMTPVNMPRSGRRRNAVAVQSAMAARVRRPGRRAYASARTRATAGTSTLG